MSYEVASGQTSNGISLENDFMYVFDGGTANTTTVNTAGSMYIEGGGTANNTVVNESGSMSVAGAANKTVVNGEGDWGSGKVTVCDGGVANSTTVNSGGILQIEKNGLAETTEVNDHGSMHVFSGGMANSTEVNHGGSMYVNAGAAAGAVTVNSSGTLEVQPGGSAAAIRENGGCVIVPDGANASFVANSFGGLVLSNGTATLHTGTTATSAAVDGFGTLFVYADGMAQSTTVNSGGKLYVSARGTANDITLNEFGIMSICSDGVANTVIVNSGGTANVDKGGIMKDAVVNDCAGVYVSGIVSGTIVNGADEWNYGELFVHAGGTANSTTVNSYGGMSIDEGGRADGVSVNGGGSLVISSGAVAAGIVENGGYVSVADGASAAFGENTLSGMTLSGGAATLHAGTTAESAAVYTSGALYVYDGGAANGTVLTGADKEDCAEMYIYDGGAANGTTVNGGGWVYVGGTAGSTVVNGDGYLGIADGGKHTGTLTIAEGAVVSAYAGSVIDFDVSAAAPGSPAQVSDLSRIQGTPLYTLTVGASQADGTYGLAEGAAGFDKTITVVNASGTTLGTLTADGGTQVFDGVKYTLALNDSELVVTVGDLLPENGPEEPLNNTLLIDKTKVNKDVTEEYGTVLTAPGQEIRLDKAGTVDYGENHYHNHVGKSASEQDADYKLDYAKIVLKHGAKLSFHAEATAAATFTVYGLTQNGETGKYTLKKIQTLNLKNRNGVFTADSPKTVLLEKSGTDNREYYVSMQFADKKADEAYYNVTLNGADTGTLFYSDSDDGWNNGPLLVENGKGKVPDADLIANLRETKIAESGAQDVAFDTNEIKADGAPEIEGGWNNFVGFEDPDDYAKLTMTQPVKLTFMITATDKVKLVVYKLNKGSKWSSTSVKSKELTLNSKEKKAGFATRTLEVNLARLVGEENTGYYVSVQSTNASSGGKAWYDVSVDSIVYASDYGTNNKLFPDKKNKELNPELERTTVNPGEKKSVVMEVAIEGKDDVAVEKKVGETTYRSFVGFGDEYDYAEIVFNGAGKCVFTVDIWGTEKASAKFTVYKLTFKSGKWTKKSLATLTLKNTKGAVDGYASASDGRTVEIEKKTDDATRYFVSMQSVDAKKGKEVYYNISAGMPSGSSDSALAMPETDVPADGLAMPDSLSFGQYDTADALAGTCLDPASDKLFGESGNGLLASL